MKKYGGKQVASKTDLLIIGGSAGSLGVVMHLLGQLNTGLPFAILIVLHRHSDQGSSLTELLAAKSNLPVKEAEEKEPILSGTVYLAPPDYHLLIETDHTFSLDYSEKVNYSRPSIDLTFQTAAEAYGTALACIILSGASADGAAGLKAVHQAGGIIAVQDPDSAAVAFMPNAALQTVQPGYVLGSAEMVIFIHLLGKKN